MARQKIKIRLRAYEPAVLDRSAEIIVSTALKTGALVGDMRDPRYLTINLTRSLAVAWGPEGIRSLPGVSLTPAGRDLRIFSTDNNIRWIGPRFLDHVEKLHRELYPPAK